MRCFNETISSNIANSCPTYSKPEKNAYLILRSNIMVMTRPLSEEVDPLLISGTAIPVYCPAQLPYKPKSDGTRNAEGLTRYNKSVQFVILENTPLTELQVQQIQKEGWVLLVQDTSGQTMVFGLERGMYFKDASRDFNSTETYGGMSITMEETAVIEPMCFLDSTYPAPWEQITPEVLLTNYAMLPVTLGTSGQFTVSNLNGATPTGLECIFYDGVGVYHANSVVANGISTGAKKVYLDKAITHLTLNVNTSSDISGAVDLSLFENLVKIDCGIGNKITSVELSKNKLLQILSVFANNITVIDLSNNVLVTSIDLGSNNISTTNLKNTIVGLVQGKAAAAKTQTTTVYVAGNPNVVSLWAEDWSAITNSTDIVDNTSLAAELLNFNITLVTTT